MKNINMEKLKASDHDCVKCGAKADVFWPIVDIDIEPLPYCNSCRMTEKIKIIQALDDVWNEINEENE
jgi:hypothetical protein